MKNYRDYYVVDTISETVVGSFRAVSDIMAKKILSESIEKNEKLGPMKDSIKLYSAEQPVLFCETFDEICESCCEVVNG